MIYMLLRMPRGVPFFIKILKIHPGMNNVSMVYE